MGTLHYSATAAPLDLPDVLMAHLHIVLYHRFRDDQGFVVEVRRADEADSSHWLDPRTPLTLTYSRSDADFAIDGAVVAEMLRETYAPAGLILRPESLVLAH